MGFQISIKPKFAKGDLVETILTGYNGATFEVLSVSAIIRNDPNKFPYEYIYQLLEQKEKSITTMPESALRKIKPAKS